MGESAKIVKQQRTNNTNAANNGFKRGFLLSSKVQKVSNKKSSGVLPSTGHSVNKGTPLASSNLCKDLLQLEDDYDTTNEDSIDVLSCNNNSRHGQRRRTRPENQGNPFLIVRPEKNDSVGSDPSNGSKQHEIAALLSSNLLESDNTGGRSLMSSLLKLDVNSQENGNVKKDEDLLFEPISTINLIGNNDILDDKTSKQPKRNISVNAAKEDGHLLQTKTQEVDKDDVIIENIDGNDMSELATKLSMCLWELKRRQNIERRNRKKKRRSEASSAGISTSNRGKNNSQRNEEEEKRSSCYNLSRNFILDNELQSNECKWNFVMDVILESSAQYGGCSNSRAKEDQLLLPPEVILGIVMLQQKDGLKNIVLFLSPNSNSNAQETANEKQGNISTKRSRILSLGVVFLVQHLIRQQCSDNSTTLIHQLKDLVQVVFPSLATIVVNTSVASRRSVLSQQCLFVAYEIITHVSNYVILYDSQRKETDKLEKGSLTDLLANLLNSSTTLDNLLQIQQNWLTDSCGDHPSCDCVVSSSLDLVFAPSSRNTRKQCTIAVLSDWRRIVKECQDMLPGMIQSSAVTCSVQSWCGQIAGISPINMKDSTMYRLGSLQQTLCSSDQQVLAMSPLDISTNIQQIAADAGTMENLRENCKKFGKIEDINTDKQRRAKLRGVTSWLGQSKKHINLLAETPIPCCNDKNNGKTSEVAIKKTALDQISEHLLSILPNMSAASVDLVAALLDHLWSRSNRVPPDLNLFDDNNFQTSSDTAISVISVGLELPPSVCIMLDGLRGISLLRDGSSHQGIESRDLDLANKTLCLLIAKCILRIRNGVVLLNGIVSSSGLRESTIDILEMILSYASRSDKAEVPSSGTNAESMSNEVSIATSNILLKNIQTNKYIQERIQSNSNMFSILPIEHIVPVLVSVLAEEIGKEGQTSSSDIASSVASCLADLIDVNLLQRNNDKIVFLIIESLVNVDGKNENETNCKTTSSTSSSAIFSELTRALLCDEAINATGFAPFIVSIGKVMFRMPSCTVPLTCFGVGLDECMDRLEQKAVCATPPVLIARRMKLATVSLLKLCTEELTKIRSKMLAADTLGSTDSDIFQRLAPLLLLRRIPAIYFQRLHREITMEIAVEKEDSNTDCVLLFRMLADEIAWRLDIDTIEQSNLESKKIVTAEERRLSAEIAGRCLPFFAKQSDTPNEGKMPVSSSLVASSCFYRVCVPAFTSIMQLLVPKHRDENNDVVDTSNISAAERAASIRVSRFALYAVCHRIPLLDDEDSIEGEAILATAFFAIKMITLSTVNPGSDEVEDNDLVQLQTGCIDFFAICLESCTVSTLRSFDQKKMSQSRNGNKNTREIAEVASGCVSGPLAMKNIRKTLIEIITDNVKIFTGQNRILASRIYFGTALRKEKSNYSEAPVIFTAPSRTCIWNAFTVASQRISTNKDGGGRLLRCWARNTLPLIIQWGSLLVSNNDQLQKEKIREVRKDNCTRERTTEFPFHPLCVAAALQVTFVLLTNIKSFDCLLPTKRSKNSTSKVSLESKNEINIAVRKMHRWSLESFKLGERTDYGGASSYALSSVRIGSLKVLLAMININQVQGKYKQSSKRESLQLLSSRETSETFSMLQSAADTDTDSNVRNLAKQVLQMIR